MKREIRFLATMIIGCIATLPSCQKNTAPQTAQSYDCSTSSTISTNTTLAAGTYNIGCSIEVSNNATLTIAPGATLKFAQGASLTIDAGASINALGTSSSPIVITGAQATPGYWNGIFINSASESNQFRFCYISFGGAATPVNKFGANVSLMGGLASFSYCNVSNSLDAGIYVFGTNVNDAASNDASHFNSFDHNVITTNGSYPLVTYAAGANSIGSSNFFNGNIKDYIAIRTENGVTVPIALAPQNVPYQIIQVYGNDAGVAFANTLTIASGTTIVMGSATSLYTTSTGTINAVGTSAKPIIIQGLNATAGYWGSIGIQSNTANTFEYCNISDGGGTAYFDNFSNNRGLIGTYMYIPAARSLTVRNCQLSNSASSGIYAKASDGPPTVPPSVNSDIATANTFSGCSPNVQN